MTLLSCIVVTDGIIKQQDEGKHVFEKEEDDIIFEELHTLYTSNLLIHKEFAEYINSTLLFPIENLNPIDPKVGHSQRSKSSNRQSSRSRFITLKEFQILMNKNNFNYTLVRPQEIRQRFTEFVIKNQKRVLIENSFHKDDSFQLNQSSSFNGKKKKSKKKKRPIPIHQESSFVIEEHK